MSDIEKMLAWGLLREFDIITAREEVGAGLMAVRKSVLATEINSLSESLARALEFVERFGDNESRRVERRELLRRTDDHCRKILGRGFFDFCIEGMLALLKEYEDNLRLSSDPKERMSLRGKIENLKRKLSL